MLLGLIGMILLGILVLFVISAYERTHGGDRAPNISNGINSLNGR